MGRVAPAVTSCGKSTVIKVLSVWAAEVGKKKKKKKWTNRWWLVRGHINRGK